MVLSQEGDFGSTDFQVAVVNKALEFMSGLVDGGHMVASSGPGSYVENSDGQRTKLGRQNGMFHLDCWKLPSNIRE